MMYLFYSRIGFDLSSLMDLKRKIGSIFTNKN